VKPTPVVIELNAKKRLRKMRPEKTKKNGRFQIRISAAKVDEIRLFKPDQQFDRERRTL
jgi:hypothetical protein